MYALTLVPGGDGFGAKASYRLVAKVGIVEEGPLGGVFSFALCRAFGDAGPAGKWFLDEPLDNGKREVTGDGVSTLLLGRLPLLTGIREGRSGELRYGEDECGG